MLEFWKQIRDHFLKLKKEQRLFLIAIFALITVTFSLLLAWSFKTEWTPLFDKLDAKSAGKVIAKLKELPSYRYKVDETTGMIYVPIKDKARIRIELANSNSLPEVSSGYKEIFQESGIWTETREKERLNFLRGLQGELERTISEIDIVDQVRVLIVVPEQRLFKEDQQQPTASVVLKFKPFTEDIKPDQVKGIQNLVAYAVEGLKPQNVKVIDMLGRIISDSVVYEETDEGRTTVAMKLQKQTEKELEAKAQSMLEQVLGPGKAVVRVVVELDFNKRETTSTELAPPIAGEDTGVKTSEETEKEQYKGSAVPGAPGIKGNPAVNKVVNGENLDYNRNRTVSNYDYNKTEKREVHAPGTIKHLSISVIADVSLDEKNLAALTNNVKNAVGFVENRDSIQFTQMTFSKELMNETFKNWESNQKKKLLITIEILVSVLLISVTIFLLLWLIRKRKEKEILSEADDDENIVIEDILEDTLSNEERTRKQTEEDIRERARKNPKDMANLLRLWIMEESQ
ncbi:MAG: flagellar basal-body MS-ring/collar protein FliF [Candidatus Wallbacteria bacterium]|nr:flagellar basal-body MS-ring/collar protein FliF [Candidatus Wallbacteria bacterium]